jgi:hypothetical protein
VYYDQYLDNEMIYTIGSMPLYNSKIVSENTEKEGTANACESTDLVLERVFTSGTDKTIDRLFQEESTVIKDKFTQAEAINLHIYVSNHSSKALDKEFSGGVIPTADWVVTNSLTGEVAAQGKSELTLPFNELTENGYTLRLDVKDGKQIEFAPGKYTVSVNVNKDRTVQEAYYLNNKELSFEFTVDGKTDNGSSKSDVRSNAGSSSGTDDSSSKSELSASDKDAPPPTGHFGATAVTSLLLAAVASLAIMKKHDK